MRLFLAALVLIFGHFFNEIEETSGMLKKIFTGSSKGEDDRLDVLATSRPARPSALRNNPPSIEHQALDLHQYHSDDPDTSLRLEVADPAKRFREGHGYSSVPPPPLLRNSKEAKEKRAKMEEAKKLHKLPLLERSKLIQEGLLKDNQLLKDKNVSNENDAIKLFQSHYAKGFPYPLPEPFTSSGDLELFPNLHEKDSSTTPGEHPSLQKNNRKGAMRTNLPDNHDEFSEKSRLPEHASESHRLNAALKEARYVHALSFRDHSKLIKQRLHQDNQQLYDRKECSINDAVRLFHIHYPEGLSNPQRPDHTSLENPPLALHEIDDSVTKAGYPKRKKKSPQEGSGAEKSFSL